MFWRALEFSLFADSLLCNIKSVRLNEQMNVRCSRPSRQLLFLALVLCCMSSVLNSQFHKWQYEAILNDCCFMVVSKKHPWRFGYGRFWLMSDICGNVWRLSVALLLGWWSQARGWASSHELHADHGCTGLDPWCWSLHWGQCLLLSSIAVVALVLSYHKLSCLWHSWPLGLLAHQCIGGVCFARSCLDLLRCILCPVLH